MNVTLITLSALVFLIPGADTQEARTVDDEAAVRSEVRIASGDLMRWISLVKRHDGRLEVTIREEDKATGRKDYQTYSADSIEDFQCRYPELGEKIDLERLLPQSGSCAPVPNEGWDEWKKRFDREWFWDKGVGRFLKPWMPFPPETLAKWRESWNIAPLLKDRARRQEATLGLLVEPLSRHLASHLRLESGLGLLISDVQSGTPAERAGLKLHDILLKLNGKEIRDAEAFRKDARDLLDEGFDLEVLREGERRMLRVKSSKGEKGA